MTWQQEINSVKQANLESTMKSTLSDHSQVCRFSNSIQGRAKGHHLQIPCDLVYEALNDIC
jgi:hypothetical protein